MARSGKKKKAVKPVKGSRKARKPAKKAMPSKVPPVKGETRLLRPSFSGRIFKKLLKFALVVVILVCLIPVLLTFLYIPSSVHPVSALMLTQWATGKNVERSWVAIDKISPAVAQSVLSSEDGQFCAHNGVDWNQINIVIDDALDGEKVRGASTITMQSVKNLFLWSSRSYIRKALEVPLALMVDAILSKRRQMEIYLNIAEWGPGIYGIEAAARHHFKRSAARLTRRQAALLAVTLPNPALRNPRKPSRGMNRLARLVERRARASGAYIKCLKLR